MTCCLLCDTTPKFRATIPPGGTACCPRNPDASSALKNNRRSQCRLVSAMLRIKLKEDSEGASLQCGLERNPCLNVFFQWSLPQLRLRLPRSRNAILRLHPALICFAHFHLIRRTGLKEGCVTARWFSSAHTWSKTGLLPEQCPVMPVVVCDRSLPPPHHQMMKVPPPPMASPQMEVPQTPPPVRDDCLYGCNSLETVSFRSCTRHTTHAHCCCKNCRE